MSRQQPPRERGTLGENTSAVQSLLLRVPFFDPVLAKGSLGSQHRLQLAAGLVWGGKGNGHTRGASTKGCLWFIPCPFLHGLEAPTSTCPFPPLCSSNCCMLCYHLVASNCFGCSRNSPARPNVFPKETVVCTILCCLQTIGDEC